MTWAEITELVTTYYPIVLAGLITVATFIGGAYVIYSKMQLVIKPVLDKLQSAKDESAVLNADKSIVESINFDVLKIDLMAKIDNPTISPELTELYTAQLAKLEAVSSTATKAIDTVTSVEDKYL